MQAEELVRYTVDRLSFGIALAAFAEWLPSIAALFSIVWTIIRILESRTVRRLFRRKKD